MLKRSFHIVLAAWLINALVCFHPVFSESEFARGGVCQTEAAHVDNTLFEIACRYFIPDELNKQHHNHHSAPKGRYLVSRILGLGVCDTHASYFSLINFANLIPAFIPKIWENRIFLPPLHHFLFRLSPF